MTPPIVSNSLSITPRSFFRGPVEVLDCLRKKSSFDSVCTQENFPFQIESWYLYVHSAKLCRGFAKSGGSLTLSCPRAVCSNSLIDVSAGASRVV